MQTEPGIRRLQGSWCFVGLLARVNPLVTAVYETIAPADRYGPLPPERVADGRCLETQAFVLGILSGLEGTGPA